MSALHNDYPLVHLAWNHQGNELAIFDSVGRISVFSMLTIMSHFSIPRKCVVDVEDHLGVAVGALWINNSDRPAS